MDNYQELSQFQEISQKMLSLAEACDWDKLPELEAERKNLMLSFFEHQQTSLQGVSSQKSTQIERLMKSVLSINDKISQLAEQEKVSIGNQLHGLKKRQNVHSAYLQNK